MPYDATTFTPAHSLYIVNNQQLLQHAHSTLLTINKAQTIHIYITTLLTIKVKRVSAKSFFLILQIQFCLIFQALSHGYYSARNIKRHTANTSTQEIINWNQHAC